MPLIQITTSVQMNKRQVNAIESDLCGLVGRVLGKPSEYIMVIVQQAFVEFGNAEDPAAAVDVRSIGGLGPDTNPPLARGISDTLEKHADIPAGRIYIMFQNVAADCWAWNGIPFG